MTAIRRLTYSPPSATESLLESSSGVGGGGGREREGGYGKGGSGGNGQATALCEGRHRSLSTHIKIRCVGQTGFGRRERTAEGSDGRRQKGRRNHRKHRTTEGYGNWGRQNGHRNHQTTGVLR